MPLTIHVMLGLILGRSYVTHYEFEVRVIMGSRFGMLLLSLKFILNICRFFNQSQFKYMYFIIIRKKEVFA